MGRTLSSLNTDEVNLASKVQEEKVGYIKIFIKTCYFLWHNSRSSLQSTLASLNKELEELKAKKDRVNKQVRVLSCR